jgi:VWFA-related protein
MSAQKAGAIIVFVVLVVVFGFGQAASNTSAKLNPRPGFIEVPVTVQDSSGRLLDRLSREDFAVFEDGIQQQLVYFSRGPLPLSAAVLVDTNLRASAAERVMRNLSALMGQFAGDDEVAVYRYSDSVQQVMPFTPAEPKPGDRSRWLKWAEESRDHAVPEGPGDSDRIASHQGDVYAASLEAGVLNDAILRAAQDLSRRDRAGRRSVIFVIGDGREAGSNASYSEVLKLLLSQNISVYGLSVSAVVFPASDPLLAGYTRATGGDFLKALNDRSMAEACGTITNQARNQYILGYYTQSGDRSYHALDVHVHHTQLRVLARSGFYAPTTSLK